MLDVQKVHVYSSVQDSEGRNHMKLTDINPYIFLKNEGSAVLLQRGRFYEQGGQEIPEGKVPKWVVPYVVQTISPEFLLEEGGFILTESGEMEPHQPDKNELKARRQRK